MKRGEILMCILYTLAVSLEVFRHYLHSDRFGWFLVWTVRRVTLELLDPVIIGRMLGFAPVVEYCGAQATYLAAEGDAARVSSSMV